jgi:hypothetical protein
MLQHLPVNVDQVTLPEYSGIQDGRGRQHQYFGKWKTTSILRSMEANLILFEKLKTTSIC